MEIIKREIIDDEIKELLGAKIYDYDNNIPFQKIISLTKISIKSNNPPDVSCFILIVNYKYAFFGYIPKPNDTGYYYYNDLDYYADTIITSFIGSNITKDQIKDVLVGIKLFE